MLHLNYFFYLLLTETTKEEEIRGYASQSSPTHLLTPLARFHPMGRPAVLGQALKPATSPCGVRQPAPAHKFQCGRDTGDLKVPRSQQTQQQGKDSRERPGPDPSLPQL